MMSVMSAGLKDAYVTIIKEKLYTLQNALRNLKHDNSDKTSFHELYLSVIEIEKISSVLKNQKMQNFTNDVSLILFKLRQENSAISSEMLELLENCHDFIYDSISNFDRGTKNKSVENDLEGIAHILLLKMKLRILNNIHLSADQNFSLW